MSDRYSVEYHHLKINEKIYNLIVKKLCDIYKDSSCQYEIKNIFERYFLSISQNNKKSENKLKNKMIDEFYEKKRKFNNPHITKNEIENLLKDCFFKFWNERNQVTFRKVPTGISFHSDFISFDDVYLKVANNNLQILERGIKQNLWTKLDVMLMVLRYKGNMMGSQQWGIPQKVYDNLYKNWGVRYEAFASPLNSRMIGKKDAYFCSIFEDVDKPFGSLGNFFKINMNNPLSEKKLPNKLSWVINPPYIEEIMELTIKKVIKSLKQAIKNKQHFIIFGVLPNWSDSRAHSAIFKNKKYLRKWTVLNKGNHFYEAEKQIKANFESVVYILDSMDSVINYKDAFIGFEYS